VDLDSADVRYRGKRLTEAEGKTCSESLRMVGQ